MTLTEPFLRDRLRTGTRAAQDALDRAQRRFSLKDPDGLRRFLAAQSDALCALRTCDDALAPALDAALALLAEDLDDLGHDAPPKTWPRPRTDDALARGYVWHSQRMALRMMARALPEDGSGQSYLTAPRDATEWRTLCAILEETPGYGAAGDVTLQAANDWLALFETICHDHARR
jgi:hypothetical protein